MGFNEIAVGLVFVTGLFAAEIFNRNDLPFLQKLAGNILGNFQIAARIIP